MSFLEALVQQAVDDRVAATAATVVASLAIVGIARRRDPARVRLAAKLYALHLAALPVVAVLRAEGGTLYQGARLGALALVACSVTSAVGMVLFDVALPRLRVRTSHLLRDVISATALVVAGLVIASRIGFNVSGLIATSAVLTAVIGFSMQDTLGNIMAGLALQMDDSIRVGDWIKVQDPQTPVNGRVADMTWRATSVETRNWETIVVPNSLLMRSQVLVLGRRTGRPVQWRRTVPFYVDYRFAPTDVARAVTDAMLAALPDGVAKDPAPHVVLLDLGESLGRYACRYWLTNLDSDDGVDTAVRGRIYTGLRRAGIPLSMPAHAVFLTEDTEGRRESKHRREHTGRLEALERVDVLGHLPREELETLARCLVHTPFAAGETLTRQGEPGDSLYLLTRGQVSVRVRAGASDDREVARLEAGAFLGEMSLLTGAPRTATVVAITDASAYRLGKAAFQDLLGRRPDLAERFAEVLARRRLELEAAREAEPRAPTALRVEKERSRLLGAIRAFFGIEGEQE